MKVAIAGGFDPIHKGHIDHIRKASELGELTVIIATDEQLIRKKGYRLLPFEDRIVVVSNICGVVHAIPSIDTDGTVSETLRMIKPNIFAKGGDRTPDNMPQNELAVCAEIGCDVVYGVGDLLNSSSRIVNNLKESL